MINDPQLKAIIAAINKTALEIPSLMKTEDNIHGRYKFVSVDSYYKDVARVARANGLAWVSHEIESSVELVDKDRFAIKTCYSYDLLFGDSAWQDFFRGTVIHPLQGAQTAGSSLSYADKLFLRHLFSVVTGEMEADHTDSSSVDSLLGPASVAGLLGPAPIPVSHPPHAQSPMPDPPTPPISEEEIDVFVRLVSQTIDMALAEKELTNFWSKNIATIERVKLASPPKYREVVAMFTKKKAELKQLDKEK